jgi:hypothetical protein
MIKLKLNLKETRNTSLKESVDKTDLVVLKNYWGLEKFSIKKSVWESISINLKLELQIQKKEKILKIYSDLVEIYAVDLVFLQNYYVKSEILFCKFSNGDKISLKFLKQEFSFEFLQFLKSDKDQVVLEEEEEFPLVLRNSGLKLEKIQTFRKKLDQTKEFMEKVKYLKQEPRWELVLKKILDRSYKSSDKITKITKITKNVKEKAVKTYCYCRKPDDLSLMVECSNKNCKIGRFHAKCISKNLSDDMNRVDWYCRNCKK